jgi:hypothetical protein
LIGGVFVVEGGLSVLIRGAKVTGGLTVHSSGFYVVDDGATINGGGLKAKGGMTISDTGMKISAGLTVLSKGLYVTVGGLSVDATGAKVSGGMTVSDTGMKVASGLCVTSTGLTVTSGINIKSGGLTIFGTTTIRYNLSPQYTFSAFFAYESSGSFLYQSVRRRLGEESNTEEDPGQSAPYGSESDVIHEPLTHTSYLRRMLMIEADENEDTTDDSFDYTLQDITHYLMRMDVRANRFEMDIDELREVILDTQDDLHMVNIRLARLEEKIAELSKV